MNQCWSLHPEEQAKNESDQTLDDDGLVRVVFYDATDRQGRLHLGEPSGVIRACKVKDSSPNRISR